MSVTFTFAQWEQHPEFGAILVHGIQCSHTCPVVDYVCEDFMHYRHCDHKDAAIQACGCEAFDVNMSNANALAVLERLALSPEPGDEPSGSIAPEVLLGLAMVANVGRDDTALAAADVSGPTGARSYDCGRPAGYFDHRLEQVVALATEAMRRGTLVAWA